MRPLLCGLLLIPACALGDCDMLVIAHRGASGDLPEHTLAAYVLAIEQGADYIEPDLVPTKDGHLIARHENLLNQTTNVADVYPERRRKAVVRGHDVEGWFSEDFTLEEIKRLRARERMPQIRPESASHDGRYEIATFAEVVALAAKQGVGLYPELKQPGYYRALGIDVVDLFVTALEQLRVDIEGPLYIQSFEPRSLNELRERLGPNARLVQLSGEAPNLADIAMYANGVGLPLPLALAPGFVMSAHIHGLEVHPYTLRAEPQFLPDGVSFKDAVTRLKGAGVDGFFTDHPGRAVQSLRPGLRRDCLRSP